MKNYDVITLVVCVLIFILSYYLIEKIHLFVAIFGFVSGLSFATQNYGDSTQELFNNRTEISAFLTFLFLVFRLTNKK